MVCNTTVGTVSEKTAWAPDAVGDKGMLLLMLYSKALECIDEAVVQMDAGDMIGKGENLIHAQDIVLELMDALNYGAGGELAYNLERLYLYIYRRLIRGNVRLDREAIEESRGLLAELHQAWQQALVDAVSVAA